MSDDVATESGPDFVSATAIGSTRPVEIKATRSSSVETVLFMIGHAYHAEVYPLAPADALRLAAMLTAAAAAAADGGNTDATAVDRPR